ncbi:phospholipid-translocating P-type ATPase [Xylariaceae sp. FL0804]|nr:phospholipid-translocating P-type ATPase [Xylariaceae sp. FL0804]
MRLDSCRLWIGHRSAWLSGPWIHLGDDIQNCYQRWIVEGLLRQKPLPPSRDGRHVPLSAGTVRTSPLVDERRGKRYISNVIRSSRYSLWSFLPKQLYFQFTKLGNFYFLCISALQQIPGLSPTGRYTTLAPLLAFVSLSMAKEGYDDFRRYKLDKAENRGPALVLDPDRTVHQHKSVPKKTWRGLTSMRRDATGNEGSADMVEMQDIELRSDGWSQIPWEKIRVGDIIRLRRDDQVPADLVLLHATGANGVAFIETMALDGETNLKNKHACPGLAKRCDTLAKLKECRADIVSEDPNPDLYSFEGRATLGGETVPLTMDHVVFRGSTLRNTNEAIGLVVNTGEECKIRMNANQHIHAKAPKIQESMNRIVILVVFCVLILTFSCTGGYLLWQDEYGKNAPYLYGASLSFARSWGAFLILFNALIPLSLYISLEIIKAGQYFFLSWDIELYDSETDTPMIVNTTTILENLGQVGYVFSDKTGTLTENLMRFRKLSVAGSAWLHDMNIDSNPGGVKARPKDSQLKVEGRQQFDSTRRDATRDVKKATKDQVLSSGPSRAGELSAEAPPPSYTCPKTDVLMKYVRQHPNSEFSKKAMLFILSLALCHTCIPETKDDGDIAFQSTSPDELALVEAARDLGYLLVDRSSQAITLQCKDRHGSTVKETYQLLDVIEFSSQRKRMSVIIRMPDGRICVFCKGADNVILSRLRLSQLASEKAVEVERRAGQRRSMEAERDRQRHNRFSDSRKGPVKRSSYFGSDGARDSNEIDRYSATLDTGPMHGDRQAMSTPSVVTQHSGDHHHPRQPLLVPSSSIATTNAESAGLVDESVAQNDAAIFERCFQHMSDFATEGLRTLLFGYRYVSDEEYLLWQKRHQDAATSLVKRQERIEEVAGSIEKDLELAGASAIEDKLQEGVPETIDKLRRANMKVWMLTGDKRETAINIAFSARLAKPYSELFILDSSVDDVGDKIAMTLAHLRSRTVSHSVLVVDGHTLSVIEEDEYLKIKFFDLAVRIDAVVCCRAAPSQKASVVQSMRRAVPSSLTLAIGDGANDMAMIQASHVGVGISAGREGRQAARVADYAVARFAHLQRLLLVHGRWMYRRTARYILATFWKEAVFYLAQAQFQRWAGYSQTSLYEAGGLAVFNVLFTSLPVILFGMFERDLGAQTLLAKPELYAYGQRGQGFSFAKYLAWMAMAALDSVVIWLVAWQSFRAFLFTDDDGLYALGQLVYTACIVVICFKILFLEMHAKTAIPVAGALLSLAAWFALWNPFWGAVRDPSLGPYVVHGAFLHQFGARLVWWATAGAAAAAACALELAVHALRRAYWPGETDLWQEIEQRRGGVDGVDEVVGAERGVRKT